VRNKIAAGEVIERPASVVKELVENALDAGASEIEVELEEGGAKLVRVSDNGSGMGPEDLALAFLPHTTSKLRDVGDLDHIASLGFRGEALASIGSVSRAHIVSRLAGEPTGHEIFNEGGRIRGPLEAGARKGTSVEVRDLFYNTPARRRFLKRPATELARSVDLLQRLALAHQGVGFVLSHDGRRVFDVERGMDLRARIRRAFGADTADALLAVEAQHGSTRLTGFLLPPRLARRDTQRQMWFLNGRVLRDRLLARALKEAYHGTLLEGRAPVAFLQLVLDPAAVDVNVHPAKAEVRFRDERSLMGFLVASLRAVVRGADLATPGARLLERAGRRLGAGSPRELSGDLGRAPRVLIPRAPELAAAELPAPGRPADAAEPEAWAQPAVLRDVLRVADTYLVRATAEGLEILDQHALHERVTFERLLAELASGGIEVQRLLLPELVELTREELALVAERAHLLAEVGLIVEPFGPTTAAVHGMPARLRHPDAEELLNAVLAALESGDGVPSAARLLEDTLASRACRSSVMAGDALSDSEIQALLQRAAAIPHDQTCPHGRPTRVRFTLADLERAFGRRA
jgi:DNA mismatch repair protein MutL